MTKRSAAVWVVLLLCAAFPCAAWAAPAPGLPWNASLPVRWQIRPGQGGRALLLLTVGGATLRYPAASEAVAMREGQRLSARLVVVASTRGSLSEVSAGRSADGPAVLWRGRVVLVASAAQARDLGLASPDAVVAAWASALRAAASTTALPAALPGEVRVAVGETRVVGVPAAWAGAAIESSDASALSVRAAGPLLTLGGRAPASVSLRFSKGGKTADMIVRVLARAGQLPTTLTAAIAGTRPDSEFLLDAVERVVEQGSRPASGAALSLYLVEGRPAVGATCKATAWLEGPGLAPVSALVTIDVTAATARYGEPAWLAASNEPERIERDGVLLDAALPAGAGVFYFHHQNASDAPLRTLQVRLENRSAAAVEVLVMESGAGPSRDELYAGHLATWRYLRWMTQGNGVLLRLGPREACILDERVLGPREVSCGLGTIEAVRGTPPTLVVEASAAGPTEHFDATERGSGGPPRPSAAIVRGRGVFGRPVVDIDQRYSIGETYAFIPIGGPPFQQPLGEGTPNVGNYGVDYRVRLRLSNPTAEVRKVYVVFAVGGGVARGSLVVDGHLVQTPLMRPAGPREFPLAEYSLPPGGDQVSEIRVLPEPGSNYPIRIIAKPLPANQ